LTTTTRHKLIATWKNQVGLRRSLDLGAAAVEYGPRCQGLFELAVCPSMTALASVEIPLAWKEGAIRAQGRPPAGGSGGRRNGGGLYRRRAGNTNNRCACGRADQGGASTLDFTAAMAGSYQYPSAVPGHAQKGRAGDFVVGA